MIHTDHMKFRSTEHVNYLLDVLNNGSNTDSVVKYVETKHNDHERYYLLTLSISH